MTSIFRNNQASNPAEAILRGLFKQVQELLKREADPNETILDGKTAVMLCTFIEDKIWAESITRQLLECDGRLNQGDQFGNTALHFAVIKNRLDIINVFLDSVDFNLNIKNSFGYTPLHYAVDSEEKLDMLSIYLEKMKKYDYSINVRNNFQCSPILEALRNLNFKAVEVLINFGAKIDFMVQDTLFEDYYKSLINKYNKTPNYHSKIKMSITINQNEKQKCHDSFISKIKSLTIFMAPEFDVRNCSDCVIERPKSCIPNRTVKIDYNGINSWKMSLPIIFNNLTDQYTESYRKCLSIEKILLCLNRENGETSERYNKGSKGFVSRKNGSKSKIIKKKLKKVN